MFEWKPEYSVHIGSIDGQHQNLFRLAEELYAAMSAGQGKAALCGVLSRLVQYCSVHFAHEERLMLAHSYPDLAAHQAEHAALTQKVLRFQSDFDAGRVAMTVQLLQFLKNWLQQHIAVSDRKYAPYQIEKRVA
jgi:hemerythrin-like metal-binding protein